MKQVPFRIEDILPVCRAQRNRDRQSRRVTVLAMVGTYEEDGDGDQACENKAHPVPEGVR